ncbi:MAG: tRNA lysidine(34) synthetase TilS [Gemmobacter sp.]
MTQTPAKGGTARLLSDVAQSLKKARGVGPAPFDIGVAVSGGGDSMALLHLVWQLAPQAGARVQAVTVDHGLRPESAEEAHMVARFCEGLGISHAVLRWRGPAPTGNLMDQARQARRELIADWAQTRGIGHVFLGHTADDQAETFLMTLARRSGIDGLAGLRPDWVEDGIHWHRPLLGQGREALRDHLRGAGVPWVDDPSNDNDRFSRVRARKALRCLAPLGLVADDIAAAASHLAMARQVIVGAVHDWATRHVTQAAGALVFSSDALAEAPAELRRRLLISVLRWIGGASYPPREADLARLIAGLLSGRDATLGGVRFRHARGQIAASREPRAAMGPVPVGQIWDHRWQVTGPAEPGMTIAALGAEGLRQCPDWRDHGPRDALIVSPCIWQSGTLIGAPLAGMPMDWCAQLCPDFGMFILAH